MLKLTFQRQPAADPTESAEENSILYHTDFSSLEDSSESDAHNYRNLFTGQSDSMYYLVRFAPPVKKSIKN